MSGFLGNTRTREVHDLGNRHVNCQTNEIKHGVSFGSLEAALDAGYDRCFYCLRPRIRKVTFWINAFIPRDVPGVTKDVPGTGVHSGKTMVAALVHQDCFLTDQRSFDSSPSAKSRMHQEVEIDLVERKMIESPPVCHPTVEVDCEDGEEEGTSSGSTEDMKFSDFAATDGGRSFKFKVTGAGANPQVLLSAVAHEIDYEGEVQITLSDDGRQATVEFTGKIDDFPAYEAYASADDQPPQTLFQKMPDAGMTPGDLSGPAERAVSGTATFRYQE